MAMIKYSEMSTRDLIDQLYSQGVRVDQGLMRAVVDRGEEAAGPLREALIDEENWYEGSEGRYWIVQHAMAALALMRDEKSLPLLFEMAPHAYFSDHHAAIDILVPSIIAYGPPALPFCRNLIDQFRGAFRDNSDFSQCRYKAALAMTVIAGSDQALVSETADYLRGLYEDEAEDDVNFLTFSVVCPVALDPGRGFEAVRKAYQRGVIDESILGTFDHLYNLYQEEPDELIYDLKDAGYPLEDYYDAEHIENMLHLVNSQPEEKLYWDVPDLDVPTGFQFTEAGPLVNPVKIGRNDPCHCGSGKKYKKCCGAND